MNIDPKYWIHIGEKEKIFDEWSICEITYEIPRIETDRTYIGYDPGTVNMGLAVLSHERMKLCQIKSVRFPTPVERIAKLQEIINSCCSGYTYYVSLVIEGASFGDRYRQVELAEIRASAVLWGLTRKFDVEVVPPNTIRKQVLGNGKTKPQDVWTELPPDAANALACAFYAM